MFFIIFKKLSCGECKLCTLQITYPTGYIPHTYKFITANNHPARDPIEWNIKTNFNIPQLYTQLYIPTKDRKTNYGKVFYFIAGIKNIKKCTHQNIQSLLLIGVDNEFFKSLKIE